LGAIVIGGGKMMKKTEKKIYSVEIIGFGLALLYATSCLMFLQYLNIPEFKLRTTVYVVMFGLLLIGSIAVVTLREWGRRLLIGLNAIMLLCLAIRYIPQIDIVPLAYIFMNIIVVLYFTQKKVKWQFHAGRYDPRNKCILAVDDDTMYHKIVRPILLSHGYAVLTAGTGEDGLQIATTQKPDLILLDVILPGIKGREVCKKLKENPETRDIPVVFVTSKDSPEDIQAEKEVGSVGHITKPVNAKILIDTVQGVLGLPEPGRKP